MEIADIIWHYWGLLWVDIHNRGHPRYNVIYSTNTLLADVRYCRFIPRIVISRIHHTLDLARLAFRPFVLMLFFIDVSSNRRKPSTSTSWRRKRKSLSALAKKNIQSRQKFSNQNFVPAADFSFRRLNLKFCVSFYQLKFLKSYWNKLKFAKNLRKN